jgi:hypothetical protein
MALLMFYSLTCLSFFRYRSHGFRSLSIYFSIDYYRFRNYRNVGVVFVSDNIVSISFSRKKCENKSDLASCQSFLTVFIARGSGADVRALVTPLKKITHPILPITGGCGPVESVVIVILFLKPRVQDVLS